MNKILMLALIALLLCSCTNQSTEKYGEYRLKHLAQGTDAHVKSINKAKYESFILLPPYTNTDILTERNISFNKEFLSGIEKRDDIYLLCFLRHNEIKEMHELQRAYYDVTAITPLHLYFSRPVFKKKNNLYVVTAAAQ